MRLPIQHQGRRTLQFNITPLIDIVFLLIIFFLVASHFVRTENSAVVNLPSASAANTDEDSAHRLTITVLEDGRYSVGGEPVARETVLALIGDLPNAAAVEGKPPELRIRADKAGHFKSVKEIMMECSRQQVSSIQFAVAVDAP